MGAVTLMQAGSPKKGPAKPLSRPRIVKVVKTKKAKS
jgi:hypothetical protein